MGLLNQLNIYSRILKIQLRNNHAYKSKLSINKVVYYDRFNTIIFGVIVRFLGYILILFVNLKAKILILKSETID